MENETETKEEIKENPSETETLLEQLKTEENKIETVKGKTEGKKIYFPMDKSVTDSLTVTKFESFEKALKSYYSGDWKSARKEFGECGLDVGTVFLERIENQEAPKDWSGIWTMTTK